METPTIALLGDSGAGKSTMTVQFVQGHFMHGYEPIVEDSYRKTLTIDGADYLVTILDLAHSNDGKDVRGNWPDIIRQSHGFLVVYTVTNHVAFEEVDSIYEQILRIKDVDRVPTVLVGNRSDLERQVELSEGLAVAQRWGVPFFETSSKTNTNVQEAFLTLLLAVIQSNNFKPGAHHVLATKSDSSKLSKCHIM
jgi:small GTP-binding protein